MRSPVDLILEDEEWLTDLPELAEISQCVVDLTATERLKYN